MSRLQIQSCTLCAWRESCAKQFSIAGSDLHCPDFTEDIELRRAAEKDAAAAIDPTES